MSCWILLTTSWYEDFIVTGWRGVGVDTDELEEDDEHDCISLSSPGYRGKYFCILSLVHTPCWWRKGLYIGVGIWGRKGGWRTCISVMGNGSADSNGLVSDAWLVVLVDEEEGSDDVLFTALSICCCFFYPDIVVVEYLCRWRMDNHWDRSGIIFRIRVVNGL